MKQINIKSIWAVLCQESSIDNNTNNISLFKILEEIKFGLKIEELDKLKNNPKFDPTKPIVLPFSSQLVILWKNLSSITNLEFPVKITLKDPNGTEIQEIPNNFAFQEGKERMRTVISINGIPLTKSGEYTYSIMTKQNKNDNFEEISSVPIKINIDMMREN
ncbi:MAG: hypothetical protein ABIJ23_02190 [Candidatus Magasanikbacteria bacterium]